MQEITVAEALAAWEQAGQTVEINDGRCRWTEQDPAAWQSSEARKNLIKCSIAHRKEKENGNNEN